MPSVLRSKHGPGPEMGGRSWLSGGCRTPGGNAAGLSPTFGRFSSNNHLCFRNPVLFFQIYRYCHQIVPWEQSASLFLRAKVTAGSEAGESFFFPW